MAAASCGSRTHCFIARTRPLDVVLGYITQSERKAGRGMATFVDVGAPSTCMASPAFGCCCWSFISATSACTISDSERSTTDENANSIDAYH